MVRQTFYVTTDAAAELKAAADRLSKELRGLVPKHRILGALITAGVRQADTVVDKLRAEIFHDLGGP
jgi:hypothetical protein